MFSRKHRKTKIMIVTRILTTTIPCPYLHKIYPYLPSILILGQFQTEQTDMRCHRMCHLIMGFTVCQYNSIFSSSVYILRQSITQTESPDLFCYKTFKHFLKFVILVLHISAVKLAFLLPNNLFLELFSKMIIRE